MAPDEHSDRELTEFFDRTLGGGRDWIAAGLETCCSLPRRRRRVGRWMGFGLAGAAAAAALVLAVGVGRFGDGSRIPPAAPVPPESVVKADAGPLVAPPDAGPGPFTVRQVVVLAARAPEESVLVRRVSGARKGRPPRCEGDGRIARGAGVSF